MSNTKPRTPSIQEKKIRVGAIGFFENHSTTAAAQVISAKDLEIVPIKKDDYSKSLDQFKFVIFPTGMFESFEFKSDYVNGQYTKMEIEQDPLLCRERELRNLLKKGGTVCCLVEEVRDRVPAGKYNTHDVSDTDLGKRLMNICGIEREIVDHNVHLEAKSNEFGKYVTKFGVGRTSLIPAPKVEHCKLITSTCDSSFGIELGQQVFFLPYHSHQKRGGVISDLLVTAVEAIRDYQQKNRIDLPEWLNEIHFSAEKTLSEEKKDIDARLTQVNSEIETWKRRKAILTSSGSSLVSLVEEVLHEFFALKLKNHDVGLEDLCLLDENDKTMGVIEVKGIKGGIRRDNVTQVELHRSRLGLGPEVAGILIANTQMDVVGIDNRQQEVAKEHIRYAKTMNVSILLTTDLVRLMQLWEDNSKIERGKKLLAHFQLGGGWLRLKDKDLELLNS